MYLELPGIVGESSTPGHPSIMQIQSFSFAGNGFSIVKKVDSASPDIFTAVVNQTAFAAANVLFYNSAPSGQPDATLMFQSVLATAYQLQGGANTPLEKDGFRFASIVPPPSVSSTVPEPSSIALLIIGAVGLAGAQSRLRGGRLVGTRHG
jgi:type VI protein secretion system component Hcp